jgi:hypothetical protein
LATRSRSRSSSTNSPRHRRPERQQRHRRYAQDTWTLKRLTLNYGARFEHFNASIPAESSPATTWIGARDFPANPRRAELERLGGPSSAAAYDVFGTGKTALKANAGKYVAAQAAGSAQTFNGMSGVTQTVTWTDISTQRHHLRRERQHRGQRSRPAHGQLRSGDQPPDPALARGYNWEYSARPAARAVPARVGHRRLLPPRLLQPPGQRQPEPGADRLVARSTIATPNDSALPLSGQPIPLYNLNANKSVCATDTLVTYSTANKTTYNGVEFTANVRRDKFIVFGGVTTTDRRRLPATATPSPARREQHTNGARFCDAVRRSGRP